MLLFYAYIHKYLFRSKTDNFKLRIKFNFISFIYKRLSIIF